MSVDISNHRSALRGAPVEIRFWAKVDKGESDECWEWLGNKNGYGYGRFRFYSRKYSLVHRISWKLDNPGSPEPDMLDHTCHNRLCVNPEHLRPSTPKQNQENRLNLPRNTSGVRGVSWHKQAGKWAVYVTHNNKTVYGGLYVDIEDAEAKVISMRNQLFSHNDLDRTVEPSDK